MGASKNDRPDNDVVDLLDEVWEAMASAGCTMIEIVAAPFVGAACSPTPTTEPTPLPPAPAAPVAAPPPPPRPVATEPPPRPKSPIPRPSSPPTSSTATGATTPAVPGGFVGLAAAHPYSTAFLMGAMFTGSCLAGAAAANYAFKRSLTGGARAVSSASSSAQRGAGDVARFPVRPTMGPEFDARLAKMEAMLREVQQAQQAQRDATSSVAPTTPVDEAILAPLKTQLEELDNKVTTSSGLQRKLLATLDAVRETQRSELIQIRQDMHDRLTESIKAYTSGNERMKQSTKAMTLAMRESVKQDMAAVLESVRNLESARAALPPVQQPEAAVVVKDDAPVPEPVAEEAASVTPMDVNVDSAIEHIAGGAGSEQTEVSKSKDAITRAAIDHMIAEVKAAEPLLAERLGAASAEWAMIKAIKAAEPYLASNEPGSAAAKMLFAVKAAEPLSSRRMDAAAAVWNIVLAVKEAEPRLDQSAPISPAEWNIVRTVKAAEPYLVQDIDMGNAASKLLRAVKAAEPRKPRFGSESAKETMLKSVKWTEPIRRRTVAATAEAEPSTTAAPAASAAASEPVSGSETATPVIEPKKAVEPEPASTARATSSAAQDSTNVESPPVTSTRPPEANTEPEPAQTRRHVSKQPVRYLGVTDSGEWKFTLVSQPGTVQPKGDSLQIQSREIVLCRESQRSWAGDLLSLWHSSVSMSWSVGPFTTAVMFNPDVDMVVLDGAWWRVSRDGDVYTVREKVADDAD